MQKFVKPLSVILLTLSVGCSLFRPATDPGSLYFRLGGAEGTQKIVDNFMVEILLDPRLNTSFINLASDKSKLNQFKQHIFDFICNQGGGNCALPIEGTFLKRERIQLDQDQIDIYLDKFTTILYDSRVSGIDREFLIQRTIPVLSSLVENKK
jgi:hypothetical protein